MLHKNSPKRIYAEGVECFVTCNTKDNYPFFREDIFCELWIEELKLCKEIKKFDLFGFCLNYDHFHMVLRPHEDFNYSKVMQALKCYFSQDVNKIILNLPVQEPNINKVPHSIGATSRSRLLLVKKLKDLKSQFQKKYGEQHSFPKFQWQKSFYPRLLNSDRAFEESLKYTAENFLKHNLPQDWKYTSLDYPGMLSPSW